MNLPLLLSCFRVSLFLAIYPLWALEEQKYNKVNRRCCFLFLSFTVGLVCFLIYKPWNLGRRSL
jgi:hypothetical protein